MTGPIHAVTFDVGGTLIEPWPSVGHVYAAVATEHGFPDLPPEILNRQFADAWKRKENFDHSKAAWRTLVNAAFAGLLPSTETFFAALYERFGQASAWKIFDDVVPCLERLKRRGLKLGLISNWDERLRPLLHALRFTPFFDAIIISCEDGCRKPSPRIFERAAEMLALPTSVMLHVGDNAEEDFVGARSAGMQVLRLNRRGDTRRDEIASLRALFSD